MFPFAKRLLLCATLAASLFAGEVRGPEGWPLQANFPEEPKVEKHEPKGAEAVYLAFCEKDDEKFRLLRVIPTKGTPPPEAEKIYEKARKKYFSNKEKVIIDELDCLIGGKPARRYVYASGKGKRLTDLCILVHAGEVYELSHETGVNSPVSPAAVRFMQ